ncbi:hypothetical protein CSUB01_07421 [Colletotrichum sublineola]|uniref:Uncharacterized protein n=1 Tax=Colletotrichum sublineola TaxID=1173701 RepID=A0A066X2L0_COLSU|nr:hypothetical protein CSUB01_07421 [Colletotrichum sublineola]
MDTISANPCRASTSLPCLTQPTSMTTPPSSNPGRRFRSIDTEDRSLGGKDTAGLVPPLPVSLNLQLYWGQAVPMTLSSLRYSREQARFLSPHPEPARSRPSESRFESSIPNSLHRPTRLWGRAGNSLHEAISNTSWPYRGAGIHKAAVRRAPKTPISQGRHGLS